MAFEAYPQALDGVSKFMAVSANRKAQAGFLCPVRAPPPYFGHFSNLTKNIGAFQMQSCTSTQIQTIQNQAQTVTIPLELANRIMDALYYGGEFIANTGAIIDTICDNMAAHPVHNTPISAIRSTARLATVIQTLVPHAENLESFDLSSELEEYIQNRPHPAP